MSKKTKPLFAVGNKVTIVKSTQKADPFLPALVGVKGKIVDFDKGDKRFEVQLNKNSEERLN